jgi:hypothetical protein
MMKQIAILALIALFSVSCSPHIHTKTLSHANSMSQSFPLSVPQVREAAMQAFSLDHQVADPIFGHQSIAFRSALFLETATNAVFGEAVFRDPTNAQDLYLHSMHDPVVASTVYVSKGKGLPFLASFHLHLDAVASNETLVTVKVLDTEVIAGKHFGFGSCGPGMANTYCPVKSTTVEEYTVLRYLGNYLGVTNMPAVIYPSGD